MTRDAQFIQQLESYLDEYEGPTTLPERVREAVRAELPKTKQAGRLRGPARYLSMFSTRTAQVALGLAAAALIVAVGAFLYAGRNVGTDDATPSPSAQAEASASVAAAEICEATAVNQRGFGAGTLDVVWCAYGRGEPRSIAFTMEGSFAIAQDSFFPGRGTLWLRPEAGGAITLALHEDQPVDDVVADVTSREGYAATEASAVTLGGRDARVLDISLEEGAASGDVDPLIADDDQDWRLQEGTFTRVWIVELGGDTLMIAAGEDLADAVGDALSTIEWGRS
jgi:hypothetical protein